MFNFKKSTTTHLIVVMCITLISWLILVPFVNQILLPLGENTNKIISIASLKNISPYTDYIKYLILLLAPSLIVAATLTLKHQWIDAGLQSTLSLLKSNKFLSLVFGILLISWLINGQFLRGVLNLSSPLIDTFHEGEYLGFLPTFTQVNKPFLHTFFIHGFGFNVLPSLIAHQFVTLSNGIVLTRFFVFLENSFAYLSALWVLWEITHYFKLKTSALKVFLSLSVLLFCLDSWLFLIDGARNTVFLIQLALTLRFIRVINTDKIRQAKIIAFSIGASIPLSCLYVYDRVIYFLSIYFVASILIIFHQKPARFSWLLNSALGFVLSLMTLIGILGSDQVAAIGSQLLYWMQYGKYISFLPMPPLAMTWDSQKFWWAMLVQSAVIAYQVLEFKKNPHPSSFIREKSVLIILFIAAFSYMRITLDRSDVLHAVSGASPTFFLGAYLLLAAYQDHEQEWLQRLSQPFNQVLAILITLAFILSEPWFNPGDAIAALRGSYDIFSIPDQVLISDDYQQAVSKLKPDIDQQSCFFTLTSEGIWYYLFNKPSCSIFPYTFYAKPKLAQKMVIKDLDAAKPEIILFKNDAFSNAMDGIPNQLAISEIYQYVLKKYKPYLTVNSHWFWQRRPRKIKWENNAPILGFSDIINPAKGASPVTVVKQPIISKKEEVSLTGWTVFPEQNKPADVVYLSYGHKNKLISLAKVEVERPDVAKKFGNPAYEKSGWMLTVPAQLLPKGHTFLRVWGYDVKTDHIAQVGKDIFIEVVNELPTP